MVNTSFTKYTETNQTVDSQEVLLDDCDSYTAEQLHVSKVQNKKSKYKYNKTAVKYSLVSCRVCVCVCHAGILSSALFSFKFRVKVKLI